MSLVNRPKPFPCHEQYKYAEGWGGCHGNGFIMSSSKQIGQFEQPVDIAMNREQGESAGPPTLHCPLRTSYSC